MFDFALNSSNDLSVKNGQLVSVISANEVAQRVKIHLQRYLAEWFLNIELGMPWYEQILGSKDTSVIDLYIRKELSTVSGVKKVNKINITKNSATRVVSAYVEITTDFGTSETINITEG